jgi:hypothetical protein
MDKRVHTRKGEENMIDMVDRIGEQAECDEAERRRRLGQVYALLLDAARQKRAREAQAAAEQGLPVVEEAAA